MIPILIQVSHRLIELVNTSIDNFKFYLIFTLVGSIFFAILAFIVLLVFLEFLRKVYQCQFILLRRLPPGGIACDISLLNYLLKRNRKNKKSDLTLSKAIIESSRDGLFSLGLTGIIESMNPAASSILKCTPERRIGQNIGIIFTKEDQEKIEKQINLIQRHQSPPTYEEHLLCINEEMSEVPCHVMLIGIESSSMAIDSFIMILRDETDIVTQRNQAESAKEQSEKLLYQILPRDIVIRINQGETDISFTIPCTLR